MLTFPIKREWFDMIESGEKLEEYRDIKPYYTTRFQNAFYTINGFDMIDIRLRNGYTKSSPTIECKCELKRGYGKEEWGADEEIGVYILKIIEKKRIV